MSYIDPTTGARVAVSTFGEWPEGSGVEARRIVNWKSAFDGPVTDETDETITYGKHEGTNVWWIYLPGCGRGNLRNHKIEEHEDGTITVSPSIRMTGHKDGKPMERHGFLVRGRWHEV